MVKPRDPELDLEEPRAETGVMRFGDDWPGVFIRGDNAHFYAQALAGLLRRAPPENGFVEAIDRAALRELVLLLASCTEPVAEDVTVQKGRKL
jgi:hypothetical protein